MVDALGMARDLQGQVIDGRYRVEYLLGRGGMGSVWSVQHVESLQHFALKVLESEFALDQAARERLLYEARAAASLRTPHVVKIVDARMSYMHDGVSLPYLVMERLEGWTLEQWLVHRGCLTSGELVWVLDQVGRALALAHGQGIVHRDLKPSNVFLSHDADSRSLVKVCDFGVAKLGGESLALLLSGRGELTQSGDILGTPLYWAPELLRGADNASAKSDQWALGLLAYRALAGEEYFEQAQSGPELVLRIAQDRLPPPSTRSARLSPAFDGWFQQSCARDPARRFADVAAQLQALHSALDDPSPVAPPLGAPRARGSASDTTAVLGGGPVPARHRNARVEAVAPSGGRTRAMLALGVLWAIAASGWLAWASAKSILRARAGVQANGSGVAAGPATAARPAPSPPGSNEQVPQRASTTALISTGSASSAALDPAARKDAQAAAVRVQPKQAELGATSRRPAKLAVGLPCGRSFECESGLCVAERCR